MPAVMYSGKKNLLRCFVFMYGFVLFLFVCLFFKLALGSQQRCAQTVVLTGKKKKLLYSDLGKVINYSKAVVGYV